MQLALPSPSYMPRFLKLGVRFGESWVCKLIVSNEKKSCEWSLVLLSGVLKEGKLGTA